MSDLVFRSEYLNDYLAMVEDTESPRIYHVWAAVSAMAAALGRRCKFKLGPFDIFPNHYILLVGNPAVRKSSASSIMKKNLTRSTGVRFAPPDTAGQRQGLVSAMRGQEENQKEYIGAIELATADKSLLTLGDIERATNAPDEDHEAHDSFNVHKMDKHHIMVVANEFSRFIGQNNLGMLDFLTTMWDGDDYEYQTKENLIRLKDPLINIFAATTPTMLANSMPPSAGGQGFLSRIILVYGARKYRSIPRPSEPDPVLTAKVRESISRAYMELSGTFEETPDGRAYSETLYDKPLGITDSRFGYYQERRYTHLIKLAMCLAASRGDMCISREDYEEAHKILEATELGMPDALGEFGLNPLATLKQTMLETLKGIQGPVDMDQFKHMFHRDGRHNEIIEVINEMIRMPQIMTIQDINGHNLLQYVKSFESVQDDFIRHLAEA
jgi:hypothetical protein